MVQWQKNFHADGVVIADGGEQLYTAIMIPDKNWMVLGGMNGNLVWLDLNERKIIKRVKQHSRSIFDLCLLQGKLYSCSGDGTICRWNIEDQLPELSLQISIQGLRKVIGNNNNELVIGASDKNIYRIDIDSLAIKQKLQAHNNSVFSLCKNEDDQIIYSGGRDALLKKWKINGSMQEVKSIAGHMYTINDIILIGDLVFTASRDKKIRVWTQDLELIQSVDYKDLGHLNSVNSIVKLNEMNILISAGDDKSINVWNLNPQNL